MNDFVPLWERELPHSLHEPKLERIIGADVGVVYGTTLTQDVFRAHIISQRRVE